MIRMFRNIFSWRTFGMCALASLLIMTVSCNGKDSDDENKPVFQSTYNYDSLKLLVEECDAAHQDAANFTEDSYSVYAQALEAARKALKAGSKSENEYAELLAGLMDARSALVVTGWNRITDYLPQCCMILVMSEDDMPLNVDDGDRLGAFSGDKCLGIACPEMQPNGKRYFFLQILQDCADEYNTDIHIVLKYHSAVTNFVYRSSEIMYGNQSILGSYKESYQPDWQ